MTPEKIEQGRKLLAAKLTAAKSTYLREDWSAEAEWETFLWMHGAALIAAAELGMAIRWIPVSEKKPEDFVTVLLHDANADEYNATGSGYFASDDKFFWHSSLLQCNHVTHWMPLPSPPYQLTGRIGNE